MTYQDYVTEVLAPRLQGDGGWVEVDSASEESLTLVFRGECSKCLILDRCVRWMHDQIQNEFGRAPELIPVRRKPFFWDNN